MRATAVALKSAIFHRVLPFFSALRCVALIFSALKASIPHIENLRKSHKSVEIILKLRKLTNSSVFKVKNSTKFQTNVEIFYRASENMCARPR